jgi:hypothetical protein
MWRGCCAKRWSRDPLVTEVGRTTHGPHGRSWQEHVAFPGREADPYSDVTKK